MSVPSVYRRAWIACVLGAACIVLPRPALATDCADQTGAIPSTCDEAPNICTFDDFPAFNICSEYPMPSNLSDVWSDDGRHTYQSSGGECGAGCRRTDDNWGYQCVELALRYFYFRWGVRTWGRFDPAEDMCDTYPAADVEVATNPVPGDLAVFSGRRDGSTRCQFGETGHVAIVVASDRDAGTVTTINQNVMTTVAGVTRYLGRQLTQRLECMNCLTWSDGSVHCGCFLHAKNNVWICPPAGTTVPPVSPDRNVGLDFVCRNSMRDEGPEWVDWSNGQTKADCSVDQAATGLSMSKTGKRYAHELLCREESSEKYAHPPAVATCRKVVFNVADNRPATATDDWDPGYLKGECAEGEFVAAISQTVNQALVAIACCPGDVARSRCNALVFDSADAREDPAAPDWDTSDFYKGECGPGRYMAGVSMMPITGIPHAILCCGGETPVEPTDGGVEDGGTETTDVLPEAEAEGEGRDADGADAGDDEPDVGEGCSCRAAGGGGLGGWLGIAVACVVILRRRR